jgi:hypothetical protein
MSNPEELENHNVPKVSREWIEMSLWDLPRDVDEQVEFIARMLREAGVEVEEVPENGVANEQ